jgi:hypothetical protein
MALLDLLALPVSGSKAWKAASRHNHPPKSGARFCHGARAKSAERVSGKASLRELHQRQNDTSFQIVLQVGRLRRVPNVIKHVPEKVAEKRGWHCLQLTLEPTDLPCFVQQS